jgi:hypothetical protein
MHCSNQPDGKAASRQWASSMLLWDNSFIKCHISHFRSGHQLLEFSILYLSVFSLLFAIFCSVIWFFYEIFCCKGLLLSIFYVMTEFEHQRLSWCIILSRSCGAASLFLDFNIFKVCLSGLSHTTLRNVSFKNVFRIGCRIPRLFGRVEPWCAVSPLARVSTY